MVEIFKTNVVDKTVADDILKCLKARFPQAKINFDLNDRDNILRLEADNIFIEKVIELMRAMGRHCEVLN